MPIISRAVGTVSTNVSVFVPDATVSTGIGLANIVASTVTLGWYRSDMSAVSSWTLTSGTLGTWNNSTFTQANSTVALGWYQVSLPHGLFASGHYAAAHLAGAANMAPVPLLIELTKDDNQQYVSSKVYSSTNIVGAVTAPVGVSTLTIPVGVSSIATPVAASSLSMPVTVSSGVVQVSSASIPFGVSSIATPVTVSTVSDKAGYSVSSMTAGVNEAIADALLNRNVSTGGNGTRPVKEAFYVLRNKVDAGLGIVYRTDDTTSSWAFSVSTQASDPIVSITPS